MEPVEQVQMGIYQKNTYKKNLAWLPFDNEPMVPEWQAKEGPTVLHIRFCSSSNISKQ